MITVSPPVASKIFKASRPLSPPGAGLGKEKEAGHNSGLSTRTKRKFLRPLQMRRADKRLKHTRNTAFASQQRGHHNTIWIPGLSPFLVTFLNGIISFTTRVRL
jgi:hypothetical protein